MIRAAAIRTRRAAAGGREQVRGKAVPEEKRRTGGSILILTLWSLFFLAALAVSISSYVEANLGLARQARGRMRGHYCALAGIQKALQTALADTNGWDGSGEQWYSNEDLFRKGKCGPGYYSVINVHPGEETSVTNFGLADEEGRININEAGRSLLEAMWRVLGKADTATATELAESVIDWRDSDDDMLTHGAENDYYSALNPRYECHNGKFSATLELLLVKGVGVEVFDRVEPYITVFGDRKVNINTASAEVLACISEAAGNDGGVSASLGAKIAEFTSGGGVIREPGVRTAVKELTEQAGLSSKESKALSRGFFGYIKINSGFLRGKSRGWAEDGRDPDAEIEFVLDRQSGKPVFWREY
jgi:type II secretory pathway component PulK